MTITGGCRCGDVRYTLSFETLPLTYACHRRDCQTWSGSAFALHSLLPDDALALEGEARTFRIEGVESMLSEHLACPNCLTRIANRNSAVPGMIVLRAGTLDRSDELVPDRVPQRGVGLAA
jgi:hypothetical protein